MISKIIAFTNAVGDLFKDKEAAIREERKKVLVKYLGEPIYSIDYCSYGLYLDSKKKKVSYQDPAYINKFLDNYDDIIDKLLNIDAQKIKEI